MKTVTKAPGKFTNVILCEDVREETGGKRSLMGVFTGHVVVPHFPATIQLASFLQFDLEPDFTGELSFEVSIFQGDQNVAKGKLIANVAGHETSATFIIPKALVTFDQPSIYRLVVTADGAEQEVMSKKIILGEAIQTTES